MSCLWEKKKRRRRSNSWTLARSPDLFSLTSRGEPARHPAALGVRTPPVGLRRKHRRWPSFIISHHLSPSLSQNVSLCYKCWGLIIGPRRRAFLPVGTHWWDGNTHTHTHTHGKVKWNDSVPCYFLTLWMFLWHLGINHKLFACFPTVCSWIIFSSLHLIPLRVVVQQQTLFYTCF